MFRKIVDAFLSYRARAWLVTDGTGQRYRAMGAWGVMWTDRVELALWFARRQDAESFCADDEDAWGIIGVWNVFHVLYRTHEPYIKDPSYARLYNGLRLFREFVLMNCTQYQMGAGSHSHPMWEHVARLLGHTPPVEGPDYRFVYPTNRLSLSELQEEQTEWNENDPPTIVGQPSSSMRQDDPL